MDIVLDKSKNKESKNIFLYSIGYFISLCGSSLYTFTIGLYVLKLTGSAFSFATTLVLSTIPIIIINPFAGVLADRFNRKLMVVVMDFTNGILLLLMYLVSKTYGINISIIYVSTFLINCLTAVFSINMNSAQPNMVSEAKLVNLNSISKVISSMTMILGPFLGGLLFAFIDINVFIIINGISFVISAILEMFLDFNLYGDKGAVKKESSFFNDIRDGFKYVVMKKDIISLIIIFICINFSIGFSIQTPLPFVINNILNLDSTFYGIIQSAFAVGLIIGAIMTNRYNKKMPLIKSFAYMSFTISICIFIMSVPIVPIIEFKSEIMLTIYYSVLMTIIGIAIAIIDILFISYLQQNITNEYRGRVMSFEFSLVKTVVPLALIISGFLIDVIPVYILLIIGSIILLVSSIIWYKKNTYCETANNETGE